MFSDNTFVDYHQQGGGDMQWRTFLAAKKTYKLERITTNANVSTQAMSSDARHNNRDTPTQHWSYRAQQSPVRACRVRIRLEICRDLHLTRRASASNNVHVAANSATGIGDPNSKGTPALPFRSTSKWRTL